MLLAGPQDQVVYWHPHWASPIIIQGTVDLVRNRQRSYPVLRHQQIRVHHDLNYLPSHLLNLLPSRSREQGSPQLLQFCPFLLAKQVFIFKVTDFKRFFIQGSSEEGEQTDIAYLGDMLINELSLAFDHLVLEDEVHWVEALIIDLLPDLQFFGVVVEGGFRLVQVSGHLLQSFRKQVDPGHQVHMLLGQLRLVIDSWVVIKATAHEVAKFAVILAPPAILHGLVDVLFLHEVAVTLGLQEIPIPLLQLPEILTQQQVEFLHVTLLQLISLYPLNQGQNGKNESRRVHLKGVLIDELKFRHEITHLKPTDLFTSNPSKEIDLPDPVLQHVDGQRRIVMHCDGEMEAVVPEEPTREDEP